MVRILSPFASCALAASLLSGCTVVVVKARPRPHAVVLRPPVAESRPAATEPVRPTASTGAAPKPATQTEKPQPTPTPKRLPPVSTAPRVTTAIAFGNGKAGAFQGLAYVLPENTQRMPELESLVPFATLYTDKLDIKPQEFSSGFPGCLIQNEWFVIRYEGAFNVPAQGIWRFRVTAHDGAALYVDDRQVVASDVGHPEKSVDGQAELTPGSHWLRLDYFKAAKGKVALMVAMGQNGKFGTLVGSR
jgi:hypothetical protein